MGDENLPLWLQKPKTFQEQHPEFYSDEQKKVPTDSVSMGRSSVQLRQSETVSPNHSSATLPLPPRTSSSHPHINQNNKLSSQSVEQAGKINQQPQQQYQQSRSSYQEQAKIVPNSRDSAVAEISQKLETLSYAPPPMPPPNDLPEGFISQYDPISKRTFWVDTRTGVSTWNDPRKPLYSPPPVVYAPPPPEPPVEEKKEIVQPPRIEDDVRQPIAREREHEAYQKEREVIQPPVEDRNFVAQRQVPVDPPSQKFPSPSSQIYSNSSSPPSMVGSPLPPPPRDSFTRNSTGLAPSSRDSYPGSASRKSSGQDSKSASPPPMPPREPPPQQQFYSQAAVPGFAPPSQPYPYGQQKYNQQGHYQQAPFSNQQPLYQYAPQGYQNYQQAHYGGPGQYGAGPPSGPYGAPPPSQYSAPPPGQYGAPPVSNGTSPSSVYGAALPTQFSTPTNQYGATQVNPLSGYPNPSQAPTPGTFSPPSTAPPPGRATTGQLTNPDAPKAAFVPGNNVSLFGTEKSYNAPTPSMGMVETVDATIAIALELRQSVPSLREGPPPGSDQEMLDAWRVYLRNIQDCQNGHTRRVRDAQTEHERAIRDADYYSKQQMANNATGLVSGGFFGMGSLTNAAGNLLNKANNYQNERQYYNKMVSDAKLNYERTIEHSSQTLNDDVEHANRRYDDIEYELSKRKK